MVKQSSSYFTLEQVFFEMTIKWVIMLLNYDI
jgi:hypothetical protein